MEKVVLVDQKGQAIGEELKSRVHTRATPLHLAFSCYVFDPHGQLLLTRRALTKTTWPGVWTNSCCGHPQPGESLRSAVRRRLRDELGMTSHEPRLLLPDFSYRAVMDSGIVENEVCPVFMAYSDDVPDPDPAEVEEFRWVHWDEFVAEAENPRSDISPWARLQCKALNLLAGDAGAWWPASSRRLPECVIL